MGNKDVKNSDEYTFSNTDYLIITTVDGWVYRFQRPNTHNPYVFEQRQRPDGSRDNIPNRRLPESVKEYIQEHFDGANLDPTPKNKQKGEYNKWNTEE